MSSKYFGRQLELPILQELGRVLVVVLSVYAILRFEDLLHRGVLGAIYQPAMRCTLFWLEMSLSLILPLASAVAKEGPATAPAVCTWLRCWWCSASSPTV